MRPLQRIAMQKVVGSSPLSRSQTRFTSWKPLTA
jgi:hypothetical protein